MKYIFTKDDGIVIEMDNGNWDTLPFDSPLIAELGEFKTVTAEEYEAAKKEEQLKTAAEATRQALFAEYDKKVLQYQREVRLGIAGAEEKLAAWDAYAESLRAINDAEGWYLNPQWPPQPEA